jgi:hypothetical protein
VANVAQARAGLDLRNARVVDDHVEAAQGFLGVVDGSEHRVAVAHVGHRGARLCAQRLNLAGDFGQLVGLHVHQAQRGAFARQSQCNAAPNALAGAGHQNHFVFQFHDSFLG